PELRERLDRLMASEDGGGQSARTIIASRLHVLHFADPQWTEERLLPLMNWARGSPETPGLWQGYLWSPSIDERLLAVLKTSLIDAVSHQPELGEVVETLPGLLVVIAV